MSPATVSTWRGNSEVHGTDMLAEEVPVALEYNGISHAVMLATPTDLEDFALGFSLSEGLIRHRSDLYDCDVLSLPDGIRIAMRISNECFAAMKDQRRNMSGRTGCGLCGAETLAQVLRTPPRVNSAIRIDAAQLQQAFLEMEQQQTLQQATGSTHAAGWLAADCHVPVVREDVGRHNALDKLIGALTYRGTDFASGAVLITSRASYEMVQKTAMAGIGLLAAVSAPTALARRLADETGITLVGFVRGHGHVVYTHPERLCHPLPSLKSA
ncbi:formate dehydrogenase accessory sulfurtransferase FdhD [Actimicrobium sp. CCI2.3]|nr:formate dehydrogenase accessory sulfurtransferase FdhD [Actimicrobium sp. CCI2.3]MDY7574857.1 formate dehydrogenase accessory sulfurtransferase FdhD [Actimicrobium sp. CCI2.3]MEB0020182.1 formate dehydrogenase accessory sulfurtransferase FdhD [Actimicrobium sp. CCI2.3]